MLDPSTAGDPSIACGSAELGFRFRKGCTLPCCISGIQPDSDEEWNREVERREKERKRPKRESQPEPLRRPPSATEQTLRTAYPLATGEELKDAVVEKLRLLEKYEIALQGDDYADGDYQNTNHEALMYAKAAAAVIGCPWRFDRHLFGGDAAYALKKLAGLPNVGEFRARQILALATRGTCEELDALSHNRLPKNHEGNVRRVNAANKHMDGAAAKLELSRVLGISALTAGRLYHGVEFQHPSGEPRPVVSLAALRRAVADGCDGSKFAFGLRHHDELRAAVPEAAALAMQQTVRAIVRQQQRCPDCPLPAGDETHAVCIDGPRCDCCWHVDFVGGARRRGRAGHDADLLVWHKRKAASWAAGPEGCVLGPLLAELERQGRLRPKVGGWQMPRLSHAARCEVEGTRSHRRDGHQHDTSTRGFENLSTDYHDKVFGIWRTEAGAHHRIDIVVNALPEELPFALLSWTGSRLLNRLMRQHAKDRGLYLSAHALIATPGTASGGPSSTHTTVVVGDDGRRLLVRSGTEVPYEHIRSERDILRILAGGTDAFEQIYEPTNRNA